MISLTVLYGQPIPDSCSDLWDFRFFDGDVVDLLGILGAIVGELFGEVLD